MSTPLATEEARSAAPVWRDRARRGLRRAGPDILAVGAALALGSATVALLERVGGFDNGSPAFILAVVAVAVLRGTGPAVATAIGSFLVYDFLFIEPLHTLRVQDPGEWLNLILLLVVGIVVGRLAGSERARAIAATEREREARTLFDITFTLATERDPALALAAIARMVCAEIEADRVWIMVGEAIVADTAPAGSAAPRNPAVHATLRRRPGDEPAEWVRVHAPGGTQQGTRSGDETAFRVVIVAGGRTLGAIWAIRPRGLGDPDTGETRVIAAAADQIGGSLERDRLRREATSAEISRRSEAIKSALLDSVSHDLRTPLASVRAAAGMLMDPDVEWPADKRREIAGSIDREAEWLNRLVTNLLDMSRVEAGELRPNLAVFALSDLVAQALDRTDVASRGHPVTVDVPEDLPPVLVDEVFMGQILVEHPRQRRQVRRPGRADPGRRLRGPERTRGGHDRGRRPGRPGRVPAAAVREVLPRPAQGRRLPSWHGHRPRGGPRPDRGDGRNGRGETEHAGWARRRVRRSDRARRAHRGRRSRRCRGCGRPMTTGEAASILLVEDDEPTRQAIAMFLRGYHHDVVEAGDAATATEAWERRRPDLIVLDLGLPDEDGLVLIRRLRREAATPILILSARDREADKVSCPRPRRRRLRDQAIRHGRAAGTDRRPAVAVPPGRPRTSRASIRVGHAPDGRRPAPGRPWTT